MPSVYRLILSISYQDLNSSTVSTNAVTVNSQGLVVDAVVVLKEQQMQINNNGSFCAISSLEVYRGRDQAIEITHQGLSLGDGGIIEVPAIINDTMIIIVIVFLDKPYSSGLLH